ncbi:RNA polymerase sigma factor, sigma-70 family [Singulisphaera sp. GP187]|uniref:RNA polymerase sigma factor n=1 Tax=Singulisphaera sp. GP187 TaxID=1882752 RepID=UPI000927F1B3|nr:sigma-70 family RNA polymerase sigma factor [Singulisphaera sp. GP187]SIO58697.1 RNA polymerase sigma factor, sigma-70 family [Singulisphaera sp. GP187]
MANGLGGAVLPQIQRIFHGGTLAGLTDGQLLERFATRNDQAAFEALLARYGPLVLTVCRNLLRDRDDVEDAFQATLLVLVRKAGAIQLEASLGPWIYSVAYRVAIRARANRTLRIRRENAMADLDPQAPAGDLDGHDVAPLLHDELARLPERLRAPIVLCYFQGLTHELAAEQLRWPVGTVRSRMARARRLLRDRLTRKGVALSTGFLIGASRQTTAATIPRILSEETIQAAMRIAAGRAALTGVLSAPVAALMEGVLSAMGLTKMKTAVAVAIMAGFVMTGVVALAVQAPDDTPGETVPAKPPQADQVESTTRESHSRTYPKTYYVGDLVGLSTVTANGEEKAPPSGDRPKADFEPVIELLTSSVAPGSWRIGNQDLLGANGRPLNKTGPIGSVTPFFLSVTLIIRHTDEVHAEIADRLRQLRQITSRQHPDPNTKTSLQTGLTEKEFDERLGKLSGVLQPAERANAPAPPVAKHSRVQQLIKELEKEMNQLVHEHALLQAKAKMTGGAPD